MKISLDWISDFVDLSGIDPETIADRLTMSTAEVEGFEVIRRAVEGVVIGEVVSVEPIAGGSSAEESSNQLATVDCAGSRHVTVCGAPNLRPGMKSAFAPAGVVLAENQKIVASEVSGHKSEGVLCSARELGMSRWHEGVLECPASLKPGTPLVRFIPAEDVVIEIDNKSLTHRPDLWGHYAFARELAAVFGRPLEPLPLADLARFDDLPAYPLSVDDPEGCPCYACLEFLVEAAVPSPLVIQRRLHALGQRTYNLLVDLTNYAMLELAQPTHAFDGDRLKAVRVATMGAEGTFTTLDGQERKMLPDDLLIWNEKEPVALAGVMGGLNSEVEATTTRVLLESANFKASRIRRTSVRLDLRTESAQRFEKSQPPVNVKLGIARILGLVEEAGVEHEVTSRFTVAGDLKDRFRPLALSRSSFRNMAGAEIPDERVVSILHSLGFEARYEEPDRLEVGIPPHRSEHDVSIPADIVEEVLRVYGYDKIEPVMPAFPLKPLYANKPLRIEHKARRLLAGAHRFVEVQTYGWTDDDWLQRIGFEPKRTLALRNPAAQQNRRLRTTLVPNMLALVGKNRAHRDQFRLFEIGHVYHLADDGGCVETTNLAGVSFHVASQPSPEEHFRAIKGVMEDLARTIGHGSFAFEPSAGGQTPWQTADHWVQVRRGDQTLGGAGVLAGPILEAVSEEGGQVVWFELAMDRFEGPIYPQVAYEASPVYPGSWQDFSMVWDAGQGFAALEERLAAFSHPLVMRRDFLYAYKGKGLPKGQASYTYRYWLGAWDHTLKSEEIEDFRSALLAFLKSEEIPLRG
ncbi:MAG: phenylalanine--tRNA ligase subunit beta [Planctomycetota bacterium]